MQTRYSLDQTTAFAGMKADLGNDYVISKKAEGALPFGFGVELGTAGDQAKPYVGGTLLGIAVHTHNEAGTYADEDTANILRRGQIWVRLDGSEAPAIGDAVYCNDTTADFRNDATGATLVPGAVFASVSTDSSSHSEAVDADGAIALIEINLP